MNRRRFLRLMLYGTPFAVFADAKWIEPSWLKVRHVRLATTGKTHRFVHFTDLHYKGDRAWLESIVSRINALAPDFVVFTGDLIEQENHLAEALQLLRGLRAPLFGIPGNHDYWADVDFEEVAEAFEKTGGAWLMNTSRPIADGKILLHGWSHGSALTTRPQPGIKNLLLVHYPAWADNTSGAKFDLILAGHSHGGQVRIPFYGALMLPFECGRYDLGMFQTPGGPLYVNPGVGWFFLNVRFNCRPELTVINI